MSTVGDQLTVPPVVGERDWLLTAPWWHWSLGAGERGAELRPALQKYTSEHLISDFLSDPQHRLQPDPTADLTQAPAWDPASMAPLEPETGRLRKIYLPVHHRQYLLAIEVHCDRPGLPQVCRQDVCEAGFVVRRRSADIPDGEVAEARSRMRSLARARASLGVLDRRLRQAAAAGKIGRARFDALAGRRAQLVTEVAAKQADLQAWAHRVGVQRQLQGWVPLGIEPPGPSQKYSGVVRPLPAPGPARRAPAAGQLLPVPGFGRWVPVDELPVDLSESVFPLYPLIPDPTATGIGGAPHDASGRTVYFGMLPTTSSELEMPAALDIGRQDRIPRFDDLSVYEIRCFVRRHDPACPRRPGVRDCCGPLIFSAPSEPYRLANPMDARGHANRPVTVRLPTKAELRADAISTAGMGSGVRVASPDISIDPAGGGGFQICSFGIPLITILATFVIKLFLPIVTFVLGLWFLLSFRLCIPPSVNLSAGAVAELRATKPDGEIDANFERDWNQAHPLSENMTELLKQAAAGMTKGLTRSGLQPDGLPGADAFPPAADDRFRLFKALAAGEFRGPDDELRFAPRVRRSEVPIT